MRYRLLLPMVPLLLLIAPISPAGSVADFERYDFACGSSVPPSGPYYDFNLAQYLDYDCTTHVLTLGDSDSPPCVITNEIIEKGFCIAVSRHKEPNRLTTAYEVRVLIAVTGDFADANYTTHDEGDPSARSDIECLQMPCSKPGDTCASNGVVTYCVERGHAWNCDRSSYVVGGHLEARSPRGDKIVTQHDLVSEVC